MIIVIGLFYDTVTSNYNMIIFYLFFPPFSLSFFFLFYNMIIIDNNIKTKIAKDRIWKIKKEKKYKEIAEFIINKHASMKRRSEDSEKKTKDTN